jgi:hypothetical protein
MRIAAIVVAAVVAASHPAHACGYWSMDDTERGVKIGWLINSASIEKGERRLAALYLDIDNKPGLRVTLGHKVVYDIQGTTIRKYGAAVGKIGKDGEIVFGKHAYTIEFGEQKDYHGMPGWAFTVKRGDRVIVTSELSSALCAAVHRDMDEAAQQEEVRRRVIFYLAWREVGF